MRSVTSEADCDEGEQARPGGDQARDAPAAGCEARGLAPAGAAAEEEGALQSAGDTAPQGQEPSSNPSVFLECLLGPKQQLRALAERQAANERLKVATRYWADRFEEHLKLYPDLRTADRADMKAAFDNMQIAEMDADKDRQLPKAHFSAVMFLMGQSGRVQLPKLSPEAADHGHGHKSRRKIPIATLKYWADKWEEFVRAQPELIGADRETMKAGFDQLQKSDKGHFGRAHFSAVMNFLRIQGRHDIGAWKGYTCSDSGNALTLSPGPEPDVSQLVGLVPGLLAEMHEQMANDFAGDMGVLAGKSGASSVEVQWEEDAILLSGPASAVSMARTELVQILQFYFPGRSTLIEEEVKAGEENAEEDAEPKHWSKSIRCKLSDSQRQRTLTKTQEMRERQRGAVKHWADRWEEWVKTRPHLIGAEREVMKKGFDEMQSSEAGSSSKAHFSLVMNFLRQSGRRTIGAWKDYTPKSWPG